MREPTSSSNSGVGGLPSNEVKNQEEDKKVAPSAPVTATIMKPKVKRPAKKLDDFETIDHLGKGAFGTVYKVRHKPTGRIMALKTMSKELIQRTNKCEHIKNEKRILQIAAIYAKSPYLIKLHYSFQDENLLYLAMEYCPGGDLLKLIENIQYFSTTQAKLYFAEMIMAVHSLHELGFLHRDLKPENFLIDIRGHIKLADFGLSKQGLKREVEGWDDYKKQRDRLSLLPDNVAAPTKLQTTEISQILLNIRAHRKPTKKTIVVPNAQAPRHFEAHTIVGTPPYMSPEMIPSGPNDAGNEGDNLNNQLKHGYGKEVDWWSLGCVFYEMLTGSYPFEGASESEIFESIRNYTSEIPNCIAVLEQAEHSAEIIDLVISGFLSEPNKRLGKDIKKVQQHIFFKDWDWEGMDKISPDIEILVALKEAQPELDINLEELLGGGGGGGGGSATDEKSEQKTGTPTCPSPTTLTPTPTLVIDQDKDLSPQGPSPVPSPPHPSPHPSPAHPSPATSLQPSSPPSPSHPSPLVIPRSSSSLKTAEINKVKL